MYGYSIRKRSIESLCEYICIYMEVFYSYKTENFVREKKNIMLEKSMRLNLMILRRQANKYDGSV